MTLASLAAVMLYAGVVALCAIAAKAARREQQPARELRGWIGCAIFFALLALIRILDVEERVRQALRNASREAGEYANRHVVQEPLVALTLIASTIVLFLVFHAWTSGRQSVRRWLVQFAQLAAMGFIPLYALRIISLHSMDRLLYSGPVRLNWILDGLLALSVAGAAIAYTLHCRRSRNKG